ncbi:MAG: response regulator transcription factor [Bacteroidetes bacterium]|jgi:DNA-binding NarL/FixJ family response regulator|nr:response regulator transcription factor [Bacteroidota bacterium]MBT6687255.1 response regulator transcription factor [Bacteroidota bacterium]MBT7142127.1 response regulator transcription factor [Bacteroidota bacterium]MBT7490152.1 response regulator transcription factor [Bacteroidota bacterium]
MTAILVDDEQFAIRRFKSLLKSFPEIELVADFIYPKIAIPEIIKLKPDIVFTDVEMPEMTGFDLVKSLREAGLKSKIVFVTAFNHYAIKAIKQEAFDYLVKPIDIVELKACISRLNGKSVDIQNIAKKYALDYKLSERETEIFEYMINGTTSKKIADELFISKHTVDTHRRKILSKIGVDSTQALMMKIFSL